MFDIILNCSNNNNNPKDHSLVSHLKENGYLMEMQLNCAFPMEVLSKQRCWSYRRISLEQIFSSSNVTKQQIRDFIYEGISSDSVKPLPRKVFNEMDLENAFIFKEFDSTLRKSLINLRVENPDVLSTPERSIMAVQKIYFYPSKTYIIIGGTGGLGLEVCNWLISKGATKIFLNSRRGVRTGYQAHCLRKWSELDGISVEVSTDNTCTSSGAKALIRKAENQGPVGAIFSLAGVVNSNMIDNLTQQDFEDVIASKVETTMNMDLASRRLCQELDHFVTFSSLACGRGNIGASHYGMANSAVESICLKRYKNSLPALAVQLGAMADVGLMEQNPLSSLFKDYLFYESVSSLFVSLEKFMLQTSPVCASTGIPKRNQITTGKCTTAADVVAKILGIKDLGPVRTLSMIQLGLDSLTTAEVGQTLYRNFRLEYNTEDIKILTLAELEKVK